MTATIDTKALNLELARDLWLPLNDAAADGAGNEWGILSAKHGLVMPDDVIEPYEEKLGGEWKWNWLDLTCWQIAAKWPQETTIFTVLAGSSYCSVTRGLKMAEDVIAGWTNDRRNRGMRKPSMGIGVIMQRIKQDLEARK